MIKKSLVTCYLVLCTFFSFAQKGEVALEIPMNLKSGNFGGSWYHGYLIENPEKSKYALLARDGAKMYLSLIHSDLKLEKNMEFPDTKDFFSDYPNFVVGYFEGTKYNFVFGNKRLRKFTMLSVDSLTQTLHQTDAEVSEDDFVESIVVNGKCYLLFVRRGKSILDFYEIKSDFKVEKIEFDLSKDFSENNLSKLFRGGQKYYAVTHLSSSQPLNLFSTFSPNKLYTENNQVVLQVGKEQKIITFDLDKHTYQLTSYKLPSFTTPFQGEAHYNSMIYKGKLYQVNAHEGELVLSVTDLADGKVIKEHRMIGSNDKQGEPNLKNSPYYEDEGGGGYNKSGIDNSKQFLRKISNANNFTSIGGISIAVNELTEGQLFVMIGSVKYTPPSGGGGGGMMMATGSMGTPGGSVPTYSYVRTGGMGAGSGYFQKSFYMNTMLDLNTADYIKMNTSELPFHHFLNEVRKQIQEDKNSDAENILKTSEGFILAYFAPMNNKFIFKRYSIKNTN